MLPNQPYKVVTGDFNGDGNLDVAISGAEIARLAAVVSVMLGDGRGGFSAPAMYLTGGVSCADNLAVGDFNGDGKLDLAAVHRIDGTVGILLGDGHGGFSTPTCFTTGNNNPEAIAVGDFNGDGNLDLAVGSVDSDTITILSGDGHGGFSAPTIVAVGDGPYRLTAGDFNGDGKLDLAATLWNSGEVGVLLGNGHGGFSTPALFSCGAYAGGASNLATGDFNHDGKLDLAVTDNESPGIVAVLLGDGKGGFAAATTYCPGDNWPEGIVAADINGDGNLDLAVANNGVRTTWGTAGVLLGNGSGGFSTAGTFPSGGPGQSYPTTIAVGDFNGDGKLDLVTANLYNDTVGILLNTGTVQSSVTMTSANGLPFDVADGYYGTGELIQGFNNAFDGDGRLMVGGTLFQPAFAQYACTMADSGQTLVTANGTLAGLTISRKVTVPNTGGQDFARTIDSFTNSTGSSITTTVTIVETSARMRLPASSPPPTAPVSPAPATCGSAPTTAATAAAHRR